MYNAYSGKVLFTPLAVGTSDRLATYTSGKSLCYRATHRLYVVCQWIRPNANFNIYVGKCIMLLRLDNGLLIREKCLCALTFTKGKC